MFAAILVRFVFILVCILLGLVLILGRLNRQLGRSSSARSKRGTRDGYDRETARFLATAAHVERSDGTELSPHQVRRRFLRQHGGLVTGAGGSGREPYGWIALGDAPRQERIVNPHLVLPVGEVGAPFRRAGTAYAPRDWKEHSRSTRWEM